VRAGFDRRNAVGKAALPVQRIVVLLVDDQAIVAEAIRRMLVDQPDIAFHSCTDVALAGPKARQLQPTVILQDLVMPGVDGFTLVRFFRADPETAGVPIIVLSSKEDPRDKSRAFEVGASDYLVKIPDKIELIARIRAHSRSYLLQRERDEAYRALEALKRELEASNLELARLSNQDGLTGLANRRRFDEALEIECRRAARDQNALSLIMIDVDFFKKYNDAYGHIAGDECLRRVAQALAQSARRPADLSARYGGEEFALILPSTPREGAPHVAEAVRCAVEALSIPHAGSSISQHVTLSLGIATLDPQHLSTPKTLVEHADRALYDAKRAGRNRWVANDPEDGAREELEVEPEVRRASVPVPPTMLGGT
jgi:two-component system chemotaxis family response regulator WspR